MKKIINSLSIISILSFIIGCNTTQPKTDQVNHVPDNSIDSSIKVGFKLYKKPPKGHYVLIENNDNKWSVKKVSNKAFFFRTIALDTKLSGSFFLYLVINLSSSVDVRAE